MRVGIVFGGASPEYMVSLMGAYSVVEALKGSYDLTLVGITKEGEWRSYEGDTRCIKEDTWYEHSKPFSVEDLKATDVVLPVLHGANGEDGSFSGFCKMAGIHQVSSSLEASALAMNKLLAHDIAKREGIRVPRKFKEGDSMSFPVYVKPLRAGSSFGITRVTEEKELERALTFARFYDSEVLIEEEIHGREVGVSIVGKEDLIVGEVDEVVLDGVVFDTAEKYSQKHSRIQCPARITEREREEIIGSSKKIYRALGCSGFARVDFFLTPTGEIVFNEVNTIPGLTPLSRFPKMFQAIGIDYKSLLELIINRHAS
ncbi:D-alanine--D-alanine ligase family protein [Guggenheimella bovis]